MAKLFYDTQDGGLTLVAYDDGQRLPREDLELQRDALLDVANLTDELRTLIAANGLPSIGLPSFAGQADPLVAFDAYVDDELDRLFDILDYFDYEKDAPPIGNVVSADWFLPEAVEDFTDDNGVDVIGNAIDAVNGGDPDPNDPLNQTYWQSESSGLRVVTFRIRSYSKRIEGIRLRTNSGDARSQLQGLTVKCANVLGQLDDPENEMATGINLDDAAGWFEINFVKPKGRYVRLEASTSAHTSPDVLRIRSLQVRVGVTNHDK